MGGERTVSAMPKQTRPAPSKPKPAKKAKEADAALVEPTYTIHASQRALAQRCVEARKGVIVCADGGDGKTGVARAIADKLNCPLTIFVSHTEDHARDKRKDMGCKLAGPFKFSMLDSIWLDDDVN